MYSHSKWVDVGTDKASWMILKIVILMGILQKIIIYESWRRSHFDVGSSRSLSAGVCCFSETVRHWPEHR